MLHSEAFVFREKNAYSINFNHIALPILAYIASNANHHAVLLATSQDPCTGIGFPCVCMLQLFKRRSSNSPILSPPPLLLMQLCQKKRHMLHLVMMVVGKSQTACRKWTTICAYVLEGCLITNWLDICLLFWWHVFAERNGTGRLKRWDKI